MQSRMKRSELRRRTLGWICGMAALVTVGEAAAWDLYPGRKFPAGDYPMGIAVADLDGDAIPDLVVPDAPGAPPSEDRTA